MTTVATSSTSSVSTPRGERRGLPALLARRDRLAMFAVGLVAVGFGALFYRWFVKQLGPTGFSVSRPEDWAHAYLVPLISAAYVWKQRKELLSAPAVTFWPGFALLMSGLGTYVYFIIFYANHMFQGLSIVVALAGIVLLLAGPRVFGVLAFPVGYLALGVTISEQVMNGITFQLKLLASKASYLMLTMIGVDVEVAGNLLTIFKANGEEVPLNVAEACSGMRMVIAFIALASAVAFFGCRQWWQRIALMLLAVPVALFMNVIRVAVLAVASLVDADLSQGEAHTMIGTLLLVPSLLLFMGCVWALNQIVREEPAKGGAA